jgi:hypothetical protein
MLFQVFRKMDRQYKDRLYVKPQQTNYGNKYRKHKPKDKRDDQRNFEPWAEKNKRKLTLACRCRGSSETILQQKPAHINGEIGYTTWIVADRSVNYLANAILATVKEEDNACDQWKRDNPRKKKTIKPPPIEEEVVKAKSAKPTRKKRGPSGNGLS